MFRPIVGTLGFVLSPDRQRVLLVHRNRRAEDQHLGKFNGLGGKLEPGETVVECLRRELREEAGIAAVAPRLRGTISWPGFGVNGEDWLGFIFVIEEFSGEPWAENAEGVLDWYPVAELGELPMWAGDRYWLGLVFDDDPRVFHGVMPYVDGRPASWTVERL